MTVEFVRFIDVPVGAAFSTKAGFKLKKILQPSPHEYHLPLKLIRPNCINLQNGHHISVSVLLECYDVQKEAER